MRQKVAALLVGVTLGGLVFGGVALAVQSPISATGEVEGCYNTATGAFRLRVGSQCPATGAKTPIAWSQQGVKAYARVAADGTLDTSHAKNIASFARVDKGVYCFKLTVAAANVIASGTPEDTTTVAEGGLLPMDAGPIGSRCPAGSDALVLIADWSIGGLHDYPFYVTFF